MHSNSMFRSSLGRVSFTLGSSLFAAHAQAAQQLTERVSLNDEQAQGNQASQHAFVSAEGRFVAFDSTANSFAQGAGGIGAVYVRDTQLGTLTRAAFATSGARPGAPCTATGISRDGRFVLFETTANDLLASDANPGTDIFRYDLATGAQSLVSQATNGQQANNGAFRSALSADGHRVAFCSLASNLDPVNASTLAYRVYHRDLVLGVTTLVSAGPGGVSANGVSGAAGVAISGDGHVVVFESSATNLLPEDTDSHGDVYLRDLQSGALELISRSLTGGAGNHHSWAPSLSFDGRFVAFESLATNLVAGTTLAINPRVYLFDRATLTTQIVSLPLAGVIGQSTGHAAHLDDSGRFVGFLSFDSTLVFGDANGKTDAFVRDMELGVTRLLSVSSTENQSNQHALDVRLAADGSSAVFSTSASNLITSDTNGVVDVFQRVGEWPPVPYCTAKPNSQGCSATISHVGIPSASIAEPFTLTAANVLNQRNGLLFYGLSARATPFLGGTMCVSTPIRRTALTSSGGNSSGDDCSGSLSFDFNARIQSGVDAALQAGVEVCTQFWSRDAASVGAVGLSGGYRFVIGN